jgi:hypothetical protein
MYSLIAPLTTDRWAHSESHWHEHRTTTRSIRFDSGECIQLTITRSTRFESMQPPQLIAAHLTDIICSRLSNTEIRLSDMGDQNSNEPRTSAVITRFLKHLEAGPHDRLRDEVSELKCDRNPIGARVYVLMRDNYERVRCKAMRMEALGQCNIEGTMWWSG